MCASKKSRHAAGKPGIVGSPLVSVNRSFSGATAVEAIESRAMTVHEGSGEATALVAAIRAADAAYGLFAPGTMVLVAVSGGPDSVALLDALLSYGPSRDLRLHVAHLDHGLRKASVEDAAFVEALANDLGLPITLDARDVRSIAAREGRGLEDAARAVRYSWLAAVAARVGAHVVATGHHADDQAETVLSNLVRGAGLDGLAAMRPRSVWPISRAEVEALEGGAEGESEGGSAALYGLPALVRPMLRVRRAAILEHLEARGLPYRIDTSNADVTVLRNRLRHEVLPILHSINPSLADALARGAASIADDVAALEAALDAAWPGLLSGDRNEGSGRIALSRTALGALHPALQRRALRRALAGLGSNLRAIGWDHVEALRLDAVSSLPTPPPRDLSDGLRALFDANSLEIGPARPAIPPPRLTTVPITLAMTGETALPGGWRVSVDVVDRSGPPAGRGRDPWTAHLDADALTGPLIARGRKDGDRFQPSGMDGQTKSIQDFFVDLKVPAAERDGWPLIVAGDRIVWVPGHRVDERVKVTPGTRKVVVVHVRAPGRLAR